MKNILLLALLPFFAVPASALDLGSLVKSAAGETSANAALKEKQTAMVSAYTESKQDLLKGYSLVMEALGRDRLSKEANEALKTVVSRKSEMTAEEVSKLSNGIAEKAETSMLKDVPAQVSDDLKKKYAEGLDYFKRALEGELNAGKQALEIAEETKRLMASGTTVERIELAKSFEPTITLAKTIPSDISALKKNVSSLVELGKSKGIDIPNALMSLLNK